MHLPVSTLTTKPPPSLIISSTSLHTFGECPKKYELGYEMLLDPTIKSEAMEKGSDAHGKLEMYWKWVREVRRGNVNAPKPQYDENDPMTAVFSEYLRHRVVNDGGELEHMREIILVEEPLFVEILPGVLLRVTKDVVYRDDNNWIVVRDYKTFSKWSNWDMELDYQGRLYIAIVSLAFPNDDVRFEWKKIRSTPPTVPHNAKGELWPPDECYDTVELIINQREIDTVLGETRAKVRRLIAARFDKANGDPYAFNRQEPGWKSGIGSCAQCLYRQLCKLDMQGTLDEQSIAQHATKRKPLTYEESQVVR